MRVADIERTTGHRPWPLPERPWVAFQSWHRTLFAHWPLAAERLRDLVPEPLAIEEFDDTAWVGLVPFRVTGSRPRSLPSFPPVSNFDEINLRTYVRYGDHAGGWFFSLDASNRLVAAAARSLLGLPYYAADIDVGLDGEGTDFRSRRSDGAAEFAGTYRPAGGNEWTEPQPGTIEHFLIERYALFTVSNGDVKRLDIHHAPWRIAPGEARFEQNTIALTAGIGLPAAPPLCHVAQPQDTLFWLPRRQSAPDKGKQRENGQERAAPQERAVAQERAAAQERDLAQERDGAQERGAAQEGGGAQERNLAQERAVAQERDLAQERARKQKRGEEP
jgi:uncharacterized protein